MLWLVRRIEAEHGLPARTVDAAYLESHLQHVRAVLQDQTGFHASATRRYQAAERTFHRCGMLLFLAAAPPAMRMIEPLPKPSWACLAESRHAKPMIIQQLLDLVLTQWTRLVNEPDA